MSKLPPGWTSAPVAALGELRLGKMLDKAKNQGLPAKYLRNINVRWFRFDLEDMHTIFASPAELEQLSVEDGDLFVCEGGEPGRCAVWRGGDNVFVYQKALHRFRSHGGMVPELLMYRLRHDAEAGALTEVFTGTTIKHLTRESLARFEVPVPPLPEQKRIADKLDALLARVDACRERLDRVPGILKRFRQSVLAAATSGELTREWREARGRSEDQWPIIALQEVCDSIADGDHQAPPKAQTGVPFITISAINTGVLRLDHATRFVPDAYYRSLRPERRARQGDVLLSVTGTIGIAALVDTSVPFVFQRHIAVLRPNMGRITSAFLRHRLSADDMQRQGAAVATGTAQLTIPLGGLRAFTFSLPPLDEQQEIVSRLDVLFAFIAIMEARCQAGARHVAALTPSLLAKAFRGALVPQDPNDEPASKLLARLRTRPASTGITGKPKRGGTRGSRTKAKGDTNMLARKDVAPTHLTTILKERGALPAEALWTASQLDIDDFYDQLKDEEARGLLRENRGDSPMAPRVLEAAA